ncbi:MAG: hypothetical protein AAFX52_05360 [Pseudomonadota bacterium]
MTSLATLMATATLLLGTAAAEQTTTLPESIDPNQDGSITREEFLSLRNVRAFEGDANGDGLLSQTEFGPMIPSEVPRRMHGRAFSTFDTSGDGYVDASELNSGPARVFDQADKNDDNEVSGDEIGTFKEKLEQAGLLPAQ